MAYNKGNFYHENGRQVLDEVVLRDAVLDNVNVDGVKIFANSAVPSPAMVQPAGTLYVCLQAGNIGLYINKGTDEVPDWKQVTTEA